MRRWRLRSYAASWLAVRLGLCRLPAGVGWTAFYGVCLITGIGFTMSLFIGQLAFPIGDASDQAQVRIGVVAGSILSTLAGMAVLAWAQSRRPPED